MNDRIRFSIVIPMYNTEKYISFALDSILRQSVKSLYEVIIINDGSTDNSYNVALSYKKKIKNLKIINKENEGIIEARKDGLKNATGEYIVFLDSDDFLSDNCLEIFEEKIDAYSPDIIRGNFTEYYPDTNIYKKQQHFTDNLVILNKDNIDDFFYRIIGDYRYNDVVRQAFRRSLVNPSLIPNDICMGDDIAISYICFKNAKKVVFLNDTLYFYRINNSSICHRRDEETLTKNVRDITLLYEFLFNFFNTMYSQKIIKKLYITYFKTINMYFSLFVYNSNNSKKIAEFCREIFNYNLIKTARINLKIFDIVSKDFLLLVFILKNKRDLYLFCLKFKKIIRKLLRKN